MIDRMPRRFMSTLNTKGLFILLVLLSLNESIGFSCGVIATYLARPLQRNLEQYHAIFRKPWFKIPIYAAAFGCAYYGGIQLPTRFFTKLSSNNPGIDHAVYTSSEDIVGRFRLFETPLNDGIDSRSNIADYLSAYSDTPVTRDEMVDHLLMSALK